MRSLPRVSVIVATFNWSSVLRCALESVRAQTFADFEVLVVGDGCTDDSAAVVESLHDERLHWHNLPSNSGHQSAPNNRGLALAGGELIAFLGHDDLWLPDHLQTLVEKLDATGADLAYAWTEIVPPQHAGLRSVIGIVPTGPLQSGLCLPPSSWLHRRTLWQELGDWSDYRETTLPPDVEWMERVRAQGRMIVSSDRLSVLKFPAAQRRDCYLQRRNDEQRAYLQRIQTEPDFRERELSGLIEAIVRRNPREILHVAPRAEAAPGEELTASRIRRGLEQAPVVAAQFPALPTEPIAFGSAMAEPFLGEGWSPPESGFRWTNADHATLTFAWAGSGVLELEIELAGFLAAERLPAQRVELFCNDHPIVTWRVDHQELRRYSLKLEAALLQQRNVLRFQLPDASSPLSLGINVDSRQLAIRVSSFELRPPRKTPAPA